MKDIFSIFSVITIVFLSVFGLLMIFGQAPGARADRADTYVEVITVCGDGFAQPGIEFCDPGNPNAGIEPDTGTTTCQEFIDPYSATGTPFASGTLTCTDDCDEYSTSTCYTCGNEFMKGPMEECDGDDFGGADCSTYGYNTGYLLCTPDCRLDLSNCSVVGEEEPDPGAEPWTGGGGGGSRRYSSGFTPGDTEEPRVTKVAISGKSYPNSDVRVLIDGQVVGIVKADSKGVFDFSTEDVTPGINTFGLWSEDKLGLKSTLLTLTFRVASKSVTTISNAFISPTIDINKKKFKIGEEAEVYGTSFPQASVNVHINSKEEIVKNTSSDEMGEWKNVFSTEPLSEDFHTVKAVSRIEGTDGIIESNYSRTISFYVGEDVIPEDECGTADLNCDGSVNLVDFSILLFHWGTEDKEADVNEDATVGLVDFSIMLFHWTG